MTTNDYVDRIADEWRQRAPELAQWFYQNMVNRTDVWGRYLPEKYRGETNLGTPKNKAITAPFRQERGKITLQLSSLEKHFKARDGGGVLGLHASSSDGTSRWMAIDIDLHDDDDLSISQEGNFQAASSWYQQLRAAGFDPLLMDSNGAGGYHLMAFFSKPMNSASVRDYCHKLVSDFDHKGLDSPPDVFPGSHGPNHLGSWLRIPGRHHTRAHYHRVWNDEPWDDEQWLEGHDAIDAILNSQSASEEVLEKNGIQPPRRTICLDFDGVIHSYQSGWQGETVIPDPPIHGVDRAIKRLRKDYRVVVHSARCKTESGRHAVCQWLARHNIEVDDVCGEKPPAFVYVDDRAVRFTGDWLETIESINAFRK
jgi:hypothetical protein